MSNTVFVVNILSSVTLAWRSKGCIKFSLQLRISHLRIHRLTLLKNEQTLILNSVDFLKMSVLRVFFVKSNGDIMSCFKVIGKLVKSSRRILIIEHIQSVIKDHMNKLRARDKWWWQFTLNSETMVNLPKAKRRMNLFSIRKRRNRLWRLILCLLYVQHLQGKMNIIFYWRSFKKSDVHIIHI